MSKNLKAAGPAPGGQPPSLGHTVILSTSYPEECWNGASEHPAVVTGVIDADTVNLLVLGNGVMPVPMLRVARAGSFTPVEGFCSRAWDWPKRV